MTVTYKLFTAQQAQAADLPAPWGEDWEDYVYDDYRLYLYKHSDNGLVGDVEFVAMDGGEPEDQTFERDWGWVVDELNKAAKS